MKTLSYVPEMLRTDPGQDVQVAFGEYKRNVKVFVDKMKEEVSELINRYEKIIAGLKNENQRLKEGISSKEFIRSSPTPYSQSAQSPFAQSFPTTRTRGVLDYMQTAKSKLFVQGRQDIGCLGQISPILRSKNHEDFCSEIDINPEGSPEEVSRFEVNSKRKKNRELEIRYFLQSGKKSMNLTTERFMQAVGRKGRKTQDEEEQGQEEQSLSEGKSECSSKNESSLNKSLGLICDSLDSSFISQRSRSQRKKKESKLKQQAEKKWKQQLQLKEISKQKNIKNLLQRLRQNVQSSPSQKITTVNGSSLLPKKEPATQQSKGKRSSKVMINPVPINIQKKSRAVRREQEASPSSVSPEKRPQSILKQSAVLTRSIAGISAFDLA